VECVILSAAKDLRSAWGEILRCAQDDSLWPPARFKQAYPCKPIEGRTHYGTYFTCHQCCQPNDQDQATHVPYRSGLPILR
jgi:hypothetical protein